MKYAINIVLRKISLQTHWPTLARYCGRSLGKQIHVLKVLGSQKQNQQKVSLTLILATNHQTMPGCVVDDTLLMLIPLRTMC